MPRALHERSGAVRLWQDVHLDTQSSRMAITSTSIASSLVLMCQGWASNRAFTLTPRRDGMGKVACRELCKPSVWLLPDAAGYKMHCTARTIVGQAHGTERYPAMVCHEMLDTPSFCNTTIGRKTRSSGSDRLCGGGFMTPNKISRIKQ